MRRITLTVVTTLAILVLLFSYRTSRNESVTASPVVVGSAHLLAGGSASVVSAAAGPDPNTGATAAQITTPSTASTPSPAPTSPVTTKVDGSAVSTRYGDVQVEVSITNGRITDVEAVEYPNQERRDQEINADALPQLHAQVLAAQSADIAGVSGATFTTQGYVSSLQSALDAANFK